MAIVLPVLLMISLGAAQYGYFIYLKNTFQSAATAGARAAIPAAATNASVNGTSGVVTTMLSAAGLSASSYTVTLNPTDVSTAPVGSQVKVTITANWSAVGPQVLSANYGGIGPGKTITGVAMMLKEGT